MRRDLDLADYPGDNEAKKCVEEFVNEQKERFDVPSDILVTLEIGDGLAILNACFGTRVNETLSKLYSALLTARLGESVGTSADPYRIIFELPRNVGKDALAKTFLSVRPGTVESLIRMTLGNSTFLKWRFVYVAKKFGIIDKDADHRFMSFSRLFDMHQNTPVYGEAVNKVLWEDLDIENTERVISGIADGTIGFRVSGISPIGMEGIVRSKELMQPLRADHSILVALKKRLEDEVVFASCLKCRTQWRMRVADAPKRLVCDRCGGNMVAVLKEYDRDAVKLLSKEDLSDEERKITMRLSRNANLVNEHGRRAILTLTGRGVGPDAASRILRSMHIDEDDFLRDILAAEVLYAKNKRFWD